MSDCEISELLILKDGWLVPLCSYSYAKRGRYHISLRDSSLICFFFHFVMFSKTKKLLIFKWVAFPSFQMQKRRFHKASVGFTCDKARKKTCFAFAKFCIEHIAYHTCLTACLDVSKINAVDIGVFSKKNWWKKCSGSSVIWDSNDMLLKTRNLNQGTIPLNSVIKTLIFGHDLAI